MTTDGGEVRRGFRVTGRVQGVGFRWWTQRAARELGLGGSVRNMPDGSVEVQAVGPEALVSRLEAALQKGPPSARVMRVDVIRGDASTSASEFAVKG
jgi:acylphosphatase